MLARAASGHAATAPPRRVMNSRCLTRIRPGIVYVSLCAYGHEGSWAGRRGFDSLVQTASGFNAAEAEASSAREPGSRPRAFLTCVAESRSRQRRSSVKAPPMNSTPPIRNGRRIPRGCTPPQRRCWRWHYRLSAGTRRASPRGWFADCYGDNLCTSNRLISAIASPGFRFFGQACAQLRIV